MNITAIGGGDKTPAIRTTLDGLATEHTSVLVVPTACSIRTAYDVKVAKTQDFFAGLGITPRVLHEFGEAPSETQVAHELGSAALIYTIGGNSPHLLQKLHDWGIAAPLTAAIRSGTAHAGVSAGATLPFALMHTNPSARQTKEEWDFTYLQGLGLIGGAIAVHANVHEATTHGPRPDSRLDHLQATLPLEIPYGLAIDNGAAVLLGDTPGIVRAVPEAQVHFLQRSEDGHIVRHVVENAAELAVL